MGEPSSSDVARVVARRDAGGGMTVLALDVPAVLRDSYVRPGQYTHLSLGGESGYFVFGSRERQSPWEIVLRPGGGVADLLVQAAVGQEVGATKALGSGFPVDEARKQPAIILVTAGAIAAARSVVGRRVEEGDAKQTHLIIGTKSLDRVPLRDELDAMRAVGVRVHIVLSSPSATEGYDRGYVQDFLQIAWTPSSWVFAAGADAMVAGIKAAASTLGASPARVISNT